MLLTALTWDEREALRDAIDDGYMRKLTLLRNARGHGEIPPSSEYSRVRAEAALDGLLRDRVACDILRRVLCDG